MDKKINLKIGQIKIIAYSLIFLILIATTIFFWNFLYNNFYTVNNETVGTMNSQKNIQAETINITAFNEVIKKINKKATSSEENTINLNNPFH